jgi:hypothetical protein
MVMMMAVMARRRHFVIIIAGSGRGSQPAGLWRKKKIAKPPGAAYLVERMTPTHKVSVAFALVALSSGALWLGGYFSGFGPCGPGSPSSLLLAGMAALVMQVGGFSVFWSVRDELTTGWRRFCGVALGLLLVPLCPAALLFVFFGVVS